MTSVNTIDRLIQRSDILDSIERTEALRADWSAVLPSPDPINPEAYHDASLFDSYGIRFMSQELVTQINDLLRMTSVAGIDPSAQEMVLTLDRFRDAWIKWAAAVSQNSDGTYDHASRPDAAPVWKSWYSVIKATIPYQYPLPEGILTLASEPDIRHTQIAEIYGWTRADGSPDTDKVKEEIKTPGTHYDPSDWVSPEIARKVKKIAKLWSKREVSEVDPRHFLASPAERRKALSDPGVAPEPIEILLQKPGMTLQQVASMKNITMDEVKRIQAKLVIPLDYADAVEMEPRIADDPMNAALTSAELKHKIKMIKSNPLIAPAAKAPKTISEAVVAFLQGDPTATDEAIAESMAADFPSASMAAIAMVSTSFREVQGMGKIASPDAFDKIWESDDMDAIKRHLSRMKRLDLSDLAGRLGAKPEGSSGEPTKRELTDAIIALR